MADIKIGANTFTGVEKLNLPLSDGSGYATFGQGGGEELVEFCQINPIVKSYMENVTYSPSDYTVSSVASYVEQATDYNKYQPSGYEIEVEAGTLYIADEYGTTAESVASGTKTIYNIMPTTGGVYVNVDTNGNVVKAGKLLPTGSLRMLYIEGAKNVRDLGGWTCDGGTVKYGKIIRGTELNKGYTLTENGKNVLRNLIKIDHELDFRGADEWTDTVSALGSDVAYTHLSIGYYGNVVVNATLQARFVEIFRVILDCVKNGENLYIHCQSGMDRCGTVCFLLESILGMSQSDIDKDYELSTFFVYPSALKERNSETYTGLVNAFSSYAGNTHRDRVVDWMLKIGITIDEINDFRNAMIDGTPATLTANVNNYNVTNVLTKATTDNASVKALEYQPYTANIKAEGGSIIESVSVKMGGVDITNKVWSGNTTHRNRTVNYNLTGFTVSSQKKTVREGQCYATFVTPNDGYTLDNVNVVITMGGVDVSTYYKDGAIVIPKVTGDIEINITATEQPIGYTNLADPLPNNTTDTTKWVNGYRYGSSGAPSAQSGTTISNPIPCTGGDTIRIKGVTLRESTDRLFVHKVGDDANTGIRGYFNNGITNTGVEVLKYIGLENGVYTFQLSNWATYTIDHVRFAMPTPADASAVIITVNEEITE